MMQKSTLTACLYPYLLVLVLMCSSDLRAQQLLPYAEKIYLQLDANTHLAGDNLYFKAIVTLLDGTPTSRSGVLYVELIDSKKEILETQRIKLTQGSGDGAFFLRGNLPAGKYLIRAYTRWSQNFGEDFYFREYVQIYTATGARAPSAFVNTKIEDGDIYIDFDPLAIDRLHKRDLTVFVDLDGKKDTLNLKGDNNDQYQLRYPASENLKYASFEIKTKNEVLDKATLALDTSLVDLQFFPEGGSLVKNLPGKLGVKALNYKGKGIKVAGKILDRNGDTVASFGSNRLGMGTLRLMADLDSCPCVAWLEKVADKKLPQPKTYDLPKFLEKGSILSVKNTGEVLRINGFSNYIKNEKVRLEVMHRGQKYYDVEQTMKGGLITVLFPSKKLPDGIIAFKLYDKEGNPLAERLVYNHNPENRLVVDAHVDKEKFSQREKTTLTLNAKTINGKPVNAEASVLVVNRDLTGFDHDDRNIVTFMHLESELRGEIENPGFYFTENSVRWDDLDALMLTQGWRKYVYTAKPIKIEYAPQPRLAVAGRVGTVFSKSRPKEGAEVSLMSFGDSPFIQVQKTDSLGRFVFDLHAFDSGQLDVLIQTANKAGKNKEYNLELDERDVPPIDFRDGDRVTNIVKQMARGATVFKNVDLANVQPPILQAGTEVLDEVVLSNYKMTPERQEVMDKYGKPNIVIDGKEIQAKEQKWSYGLYSILLFEYGDIVRIRRDSAQVMRAQVYFDTTLIVVDGIPVLGYQYDLIPYIDPSEVKSFEIIEFANNISTLYGEAYPQSSPMEWPNMGHVIAIYTHAGAGILGTQKPKGIKTTSLPVFEPPKTFYAPTYPQSSNLQNEGKDVRAVVHWEPKVDLDGGDPTALSFYNTDLKGTFTIIAELIAEDGKIGYKIRTYEVQ